MRLALEEIVVLRIIKTRKWVGLGLRAGLRSGVCVYIARMSTQLLIVDDMTIIDLISDDDPATPTFPSRISNKHDRSGNQFDVVPSSVSPCHSSSPLRNGLHLAIAAPTMKPVYATPINIADSDMSSPGLPSPSAVIAGKIRKPIRGRDTTKLKQISSFAEKLQPTPYSDPIATSSDPPVETTATKRKAIATAASQAKKRLKELERLQSKELKQVNKLKTTKLEQTQEMIVQLHPSLYEETEENAEMTDKKTKIGNVLRPRFEEMGCEMRTTDEATPDNTIIWSRKVNATYDEEKGHYVPLGKEIIQDEAFVLMLVEADNFLESLTAIPELLQPVRQAFTGKKIIFMLQGLRNAVQKVKTAKARKFQAAVRRELAEVNGSQPRKEKDAEKESANVPTESEIEDALMHLQIVEKCFIMQTRNRTETLEWLPVLTTDIATIPYKKRASRMSSLSFCTDVGQVRTGKDAIDTWHRMLQEIPRVTQSISDGIARRYPSMKLLVEAFRQHGDGILAEIDISNMKLGMPSKRTIGKALSKRVHDIFMGMDPTVMVG